MPEQEDFLLAVLDAAIDANDNEREILHEMAANPKQWMKRLEEKELPDPLGEGGDEAKAKELARKMVAARMRDSAAAKPTEAASTERSSVAPVSVKKGRKTQGPASCKTRMRR
jgi:16S rRNA C1402 N4-methylase RsmH